MTSMRRIIQNALKQIKLKKIELAEDGAQAFKMLSENKYDLIISDWNMPKMTGIELLKKVRNTEGYEKTPFVMVTAEGHKENVIEAVQAGVNQYIVKPFTNEQLYKKLENIFGKISY